MGGKFRKYYRKVPFIVDIRLKKSEPSIFVLLNQFYQNTLYLFWIINCDVTYRPNCETPIPYTSTTIIWNLRIYDAMVAKLDILWVCGKQTFSDSTKATDLAILDMFDVSASLPILYFGVYVSQNRQHWWVRPTSFTKYLFFTGTQYSHHLLTGNVAFVTFTIYARRSFSRGSLLRAKGQFETRCVDLCRVPRWNKTIK